MKKVQLGEQGASKRLGVLGGHFVEEEHEKQKQPSHPQVYYEIYRVISVMAWCLQKEIKVQISKNGAMLFNMKLDLNPLDTLKVKFLK